MPTTPTDHVPKHKRVLRDGQTHRGPARWLRAADTAMRHPMSKHGQLFFGRVARAQQIVEEYPTTAREVKPYAHPHIDWSLGRGAVQREGGFKYYTCSLFCCAMVAQLDWGLKTYHALVVFLMSGEVTRYNGEIVSVPTPLGFTDPPRTVRCQFCHSKIEPV